ncbi:hypothetical protein KKG41_04075 [Patescibacteria group bacterium]|nr:hypothetical protein [Patescibacteria group bacterium]
MDRYLNTNNLFIMYTYDVFIVSNNLCTVLDIGMINDLLRRMYEHKRGEIRGFSQRYHFTQLLYFEEKG